MRRTYWVANGTKAGNWNTIEARGATRLNGRTLGLIGLGRIGTQTFTLKLTRSRHRRCIESESIQLESLVLRSLY
jgi:hypothetical protein